VLPVISAVTFLGFLDTHLLIPVMSLFASELGAGVGIAGLIIGLYSITNTPFNILFGRLIDRFGSRRPLIIGLIGDALSMFLYSVCRLPFHLALVRAFHGTSGGLVGPSTMSIIADYSDRVQKGRTMAFYGMALAAATLVGYGLSGFLVSRLGYNAVFWFGSAVLVLGVGVSQLLPGKAKKGAVVVSPISGGGLKKVKDLLRRRELIVAYCSVFAQYFTFGGVVTLMPFHIEKLGMEAFHVGMLLATFAIMFIIVQFPGGALSDRLGRRVPTVIALVLGIVSLVILPLQSTFALLAVAMGLYGVAFGILFPSISAMVADNALPEERGTATGIFHALLTAGVAVGAPIIGWTGQGVGIRTGMLVIPAIMAVALAVALASLRQR
jgi:MFS family permease